MELDQAASILHNSRRVGKS